MVSSVEKEVPQHRDKFNRLLEIGTHVVYPDRNQLLVGVVDKLTPKMCTVKELRLNGRWSSSLRKYPQDLAIVEGKDVTMYIIRNSA